jgi:hypothetical protein
LALTVRLNSAAAFFPCFGNEVVGSFIRFADDLIGPVVGFLLQPIRDRTRGGLGDRVRRAGNERVCPSRPPRA